MLAAKAAKAHSHRRKPVVGKKTTTRAADAAIATMESKLPSPLRGLTDLGILFCRLTPAAICFRGFAAGYEQTKETPISNPQLHFGQNAQFARNNSGDDGCVPELLPARLRRTCRHFSFRRVRGYVRQDVDGSVKDFVEGKGSYPAISYTRAVASSATRRSARGAFFGAPN